MNDIDELLRSSDPARATWDDRAENELRAILHARPAQVRAARRGLLVAAVGATSIALVVGLFGLTSNVGQQAAGDYQWYSTSDELEEAASAVLLVHITDQGPFQQEGFSYIVKTARVVDDAGSGHPEGSTVLIKQLTNTAEPDVNLEIGKSYVVFVEEYENSPASLLNPIQAAFEVRDGRAIALSDDAPRLDDDLLARLGLSG